MHPEISQNQGLLNVATATKVTNNTLPTTNKVPVLNTEDQLQQAFNNRGTTKKSRKEVWELPLVPNENDYHSDGTGTKEKSNMGVIFTHSAPNSDFEQEHDPGGKKQVEAHSLRHLRQLKVSNGIQHSWFFVL